MKVIIAGSRELCITHEDIWDAVKVNDMGLTVVICGECRGPDTVGKAWAHRNKIPVWSLPAPWETYGRRKAGRMRNEAMAAIADKAILFWDQKSTGTWDMYQKMRQLGKPVYMINCEPEVKLKGEKFQV